MPKPGKTPDNLANFRPISLLNADIKLYAKTLARRLLKVLPTLINRDQVGFIRGRQAPDGTRRLLNILSHAESSKTPTLLLSLDAEKAFDRIYWGFILKNLDKFGFAGNIYSAVKALYTNPTANVLVNGVLSKPFRISNGTRQGCPLFPLIFDLAMEPLAEAIRSHTGIRGVEISTIHHKINIFADDVILTLTDVDKSLANTTTLLKLYGSLSYYKVNTSKSLILDLSLTPSMKHRLKNRFPYSWQESSLPYLGIHLTRNLSNLIKANFPPLLKSTQLEIDRIAKVENSWWGRIVLYKMIVLPKIVCI